jgi:hypothetical protein
MITEVDLLEFGFKKNSETAEATGYEYDWYYYTLYIGDICLISNSNDELNENGSWTVYLFNHNSIVITSKTKLWDLVYALRQVII